MVTTKVKIFDVLKFLDIESKKKLTMLLSGNIFL